MPRDTSVGRFRDGMSVTNQAEELTSRAPTWALWGRFAFKLVGRSELDRPGIYTCFCGSETPISSNSTASRSAMTETLSRDDLGIAYTVRAPVGLNRVKPSVQQTSAYIRPRVFQTPHPAAAGRPWTLLLELPDLTHARSLLSPSKQPDEQQQQLPPLPLHHPSATS